MNISLKKYPSLLFECLIISNSVQLKEKIFLCFLFKLISRNSVLIPYVASSQYMLSLVFFVDNYETKKDKEFIDF